MSDQAIEITIDGKVTLYNPSDITANDAKDFRRAVGIPLSKALREDSEDIDTIAGLVWLVERRTDASCTYADVAGSINFGSKIVFGPNVAAKPDAEEDKEEPGDSPEA